MESDTRLRRGRVVLEWIEVRLKRRHFSRVVVGLVHPSIVFAPGAKSFGVAGTSPATPVRGRNLLSGLTGVGA
jgi:hypothetical protein